jgi:uncharacterized membrane protein
MLRCMNRALMVAVAGCVVAVIGAALPWVVVATAFGVPDRIGFRQFEVQALITGATLGTLAVFLYQRPAGYLIATVAGLAAVILGLVGLAHAQDAVGSITAAVDGADPAFGAAPSAAIGPGPYISILGAGLVLLGGLVGLRDSLLRPPAPRDIAPR